MRQAHILYVTFGLCCAGPPDNAPDQATERVEVEVTTDRAVYAPDDPVVATLAIRNADTEPARLDFATGQRYDFTIRNAAGDTVWRWGDRRGFLQVLGTEDLGPGEALAFTEPFNGALPPGHYRLRGTVPTMERVLSDETTFEVR